MQESVVLITSQQSENRTFGTGFLIHRHQKSAYIVTCAHVIKDVGGSESVYVDGLPATVVALGEEDGFDLAILKIEERQKRPLFRLSSVAQKKNSFTILGFSLFDKIHVIRRLSGVLGEPIGLESKIRRERTLAWDIEIEGKNYLQRGYSGSPVIHQIEGSVIGVVTHLKGKGEKGLAISIKTLEKIWSDIPCSLLQEGEQQECQRNSSVLLAPDFPDFWGRTKELEVLLQQTSRIILIDGEPGIGKTYIASQLAQRLNPDYRVLWIDKQNITIDGLMFYVNEELKKDSRYGFVTIYAETKLKTQEKIPNLIDVLSSSTTPKYALFIDNYQNNYKSDFNLFVDRFSTHGGDNKLILISNEFIDFGLSLSTKIKRNSISGFQGKEGIDYIIKSCQEYEIQWTNKDVKKVIKITGGHPLAINLIIKCCAIGIPLEVVLGNLLKYAKKFGSELYQKLLEDLASRLTNEEEKAMHRLAVFRTPVQRLSWKLLEISEEVGESLLQRGLLTFVDRDKFQMHPLIREFWWKSIKSENERFFSHEKAAFYYWNKAKKNTEESNYCAQDRLDFDLYSEAYYHFKKNEQQELVCQVLEDFICTTHKQERLLLGLPSLKIWLTELDVSSCLNQPWILLEIARTNEEEATNSSRTKAETLFSKSYDVFNQLGDKLGAAIALYYKGKILHLKNQPDAALTILKLVLNLAEEMKDVHMQIRTLAKMTSCYTDLHRYDEAVIAANRAEQFAQKIGDRLGQALIIYRKGSIERRRSNFEEAERYFSTSAKAFEAQDDRYRASKSLSRLGVVQDKLGKFEEAISYLKRAIEIKENLSDKYGLALDMDYLGDVYRSQGLHKKAKEYYQKSLTIKEQQCDLYGIVKSYNNLARNSLLSSDFERVTVFLEKAKQNLEKLKKIQGKYKGLEGAFLTIKGDFQFEKKEYQEAIKSYNNARAYFVPPQHSYARASLSLGRIYLDLRDFGQAQAFLNESLELFKNNSTRYHEALTLNYLARLELLSASVEVAKTNYLLAIDIAKRINAQDILLACRRTKVLLDIIESYLDDENNDENNDDKDNSRQTLLRQPLVRQKLVATYRARLLVFDGKLEKAKEENNRVIRLASKLEAANYILAICNETKAIIEEGEILDKFGSYKTEEVNKIKEELIQKIWNKYDNALQEFLVQDSKLVIDITRVRIKKNLWRLVVKSLINETPILAEEDYKSIGMIEKNLDILESVIQQEYLSIRYSIYENNTQNKYLINRRAIYLLTILSPLVKRLNLRIEVLEEEQLAFKLLYPNQFKKITNFISEKFKNQETFLANLSQEISKKLQIFKIDAKVICRNKSPYSIYRKITERKGVTLEKILDFVAFRIITETVDDCYRVLDIVDDMGSRFQGDGILVEPLRDYIKNPKKSTGYQSIHVNIKIPANLNKYGESCSHVVEFQIRTQAMDAHAEHGESAHSYYKDVSHYSKPDLTKNFRSAQKSTKLLIECERSLIGDVGQIIRSKGFDILSVDIRGLIHQRILLTLEVRSRGEKLYSSQDYSAITFLINSLESLTVSDT